MERSDQLDEQIAKSVQERQRQIKDAQESKRLKERKDAEAKIANTKMIEDHHSIIQRELQKSRVEDDVHFKLRLKMIEVYGRLQRIRNSESVTNMDKTTELEQQYQALLEEYLNRPVDLGKITLVAQPIYKYKSGPVEISLLPDQRSGRYIANEGPYVINRIGDWEVELDPVTHKPARLVRWVTDTSGTLQPPPKLKTYLAVEILEK
jgi:hypothetical protein